jgi:ADP-ribose pyrophosphatase YjhB (NUDIX family)
MPKAITCAIILEQNGKLLLVQEADPEFYGQWNQPAGHLDPGETIIECALREAREESGYEVEITGLQAIYDYAITRDGEHYHIISFCFRATPRGEPGPIMEDEILATRWFTKEELKQLPDDQLRHSLTKRRIEDWLAGQCGPLDLIIPWGSWPTKREDGG